MIQVESARDGQKILRKNGRLLCSSFEPQREAAVWAERALEGLTERDTLIVLGMGAGYHFIETLKRRPAGALVVIDNDAVVAKAALEIHPQIPAADVIVEASWLQLLQNARFQAAVLGIYRIAVHGPSRQVSPEYFQSVESLLLGRDRASFLLQVKMRPELYEQLDIEAAAKLSAAEPISIQTMKKLFKPEANASRERKLWRVLEELVL